MIDWQARREQLISLQELITGSLQEIKTVLRNDASARAKAADVYGLMVRYISRQDDEFYRALKSCHAEDYKALKMIDFFIQDLKALKVSLFVFEDQYLTGRLGNAGKGFVTDWLGLSRDILTRFQTEQVQLFPLLVPSKGSSVAS